MNAIMRNRVLPFFVAGLAILALALSTRVEAQAPAANSGRAAAKSTPAPAAVAPPANLKLIDLAGYKQIVARYKGQPLLVTFWATWCEPCREEYPMIVKLAMKYQVKGLQVIGVDMDDDADMNLVRHFLTQNQPMFTNYRQRPGIDLDEFYRGANPEWQGTMPETIFYGRDGQIAVSFVGEKTQGDFERAIQTILAKHPGA